MPNHVTSIIKLTGDRKKIEEMLEAVKTDEIGIGSLDFNKVIPMPESLNITSGTATERGYEAYKGFMEVYTLFGTTNMDSILHVPPSSEDAFLRQRPDIDRSEFELGKQAFQNEMRYGATTWYDWCINNWGTKWNSYGYDYFDRSDPSTIGFHTAWSAPHPIIEKLAKRYPEVSIEHQWADEDIGYNCGRRIYENGACIEQYLPEGEEATEFAMNLLGYGDSEETMEEQSL